MTRKFRTILLAAPMTMAVWLASPGIAQIDEIPPILEPSPSPSPDPPPPDRDEPTREPRERERERAGDGGGRKGRAAEKERAPEPMDPVVRRGLEVWQARLDERTPARTTTRLLDLLGEVSTEPLAPAERRRAFGRFPVVGYVWYQDDWAAPRYLPYFHLHEGTDLFARRGTPVMAVTDGAIWKLSRSASGGGRAVWLLGDDEVRYYYGHLHRVQAGLRVGDRVERGDKLGTVGNSGTARGTYPHVHFEINPGGRGTINPKPILDAWLDDAEDAALRRLGLVRQRSAMAAFGTARWDALVDLLSEPATRRLPMWGLGFDTATALTADRVLDEILAASDPASLGVFGGASGPVRFDPLARLLASHADG